MTDTRQNMQRLTQWVRMPGSARTRFKRHANNEHTGGVRGLIDRVLPDGSGEPFVRGLCGGAATEWEDVQDDSLICSQLS